MDKKYSWWLVQGNPLCDRPCKILLVDGTEEVAHYDGYFNPKSGLWTMYILKSYAGRMPDGKATCAEADVVDRRKK